MLKRVAKDAVLPTIDLEIETGLGEKIKFGITYYARNLKEFRERVDNLAKDEASVADFFNWLVKSWEADYEITAADLDEMESEYPDILQAVITAWKRAKEVRLVKN